MHHVKSLGYFVAVAQNKSIREAAETLHLTPSALNRHILDLEGELGAPLFERHARGVRLSAAGEAYLVYAKGALRDAALAHSHIDALRGLRRGHIRLAAVAAVADAKLMDLIVRFQRDYPQVGFSLSVMGAEKVVEAVLAHDADLGLAFNPPAQSDFYKVAERGYAIHAVMAQDHPLAANTSVSIFTLQEYPLGMADRCWGGRRLLDEYLSKTGLKLQPQMVSNSFEVLITFVRMANGVCFQIRPGLDSEQLDDGLIAIPITELRRYERSMVLGTLKGRVLPVAAALFCETLKKEFFNRPPNTNEN